MIKKITLMPGQKVPVAFMDLNGIPPPMEPGHAIFSSDEKVLAIEMVDPVSGYIVAVAPGWGMVFVRDDDGGRTDILSVLVVQVEESAAAGPIKLIPAKERRPK